MSARSLQSFPVWDLPIRWFHWINFVCVLCLAAIGTAILFEKELGLSDGGKVLLKTIHVLIGYVFVTNLAWRVPWAFLGSRQARRSAILPLQKGYGAEFKTYLRELIRGNVPPYLGHNPVARLMVSLLIILLSLQAVTDSSRWDGYLLSAVRSLNCWLGCGCRGRSFNDCPLQQNRHRSHIVEGDAFVPLRVLDHPLLEFLTHFLSSSRSISSEWS